MSGKPRRSVTAQFLWCPGPVGLFQVSDSFASEWYQPAGRRSKMRCLPQLQTKETPRAASPPANLDSDGASKPNKPRCPPGFEWGVRMFAQTGFAGNPPSLDGFEEGTLYMSLERHQLACSLNFPYPLPYPNAPNSP